VTEDEYLQHLRKKDCFGTAPQKKSKLLKALAHLEKIHEEINKKNQDLAKKLRENIPTEKGLKSTTTISLEKLAGMIWNMYNCMSHYEQTEMKGRMSRDFAKAWKKGFEECILEFIKTAGSNALNARVTKFDKMKVNYASKPPAEDASSSTGRHAKGGGTSFLVSPPPASSNTSTSEVATAASFASFSSTPAHYEQEEIEKQVQDMYNRVVQRSLLVSQVVVASREVVNVDSGAIEEIQDSSQQDLARERLIYLLNDENRSFLFNLIENLLFFYGQQQGQDVPSSQDVADSIDNIQTGYPSPPRRKYRRS
jgi:hypothetical protein